MSVRDRLPNPAPADQTHNQNQLLSYSTLGCFLLLSVAALHLAAVFLIPVTLALLIALVLSPVIRFFWRLGVPAPLSALLMVATLIGTVFFAAYFLSTPLSRWVAEAPETLSELQYKFDSVLRPMREVEQATTEAVGGNEAKPDVQKVVVQDPGLLSRMVTGAPEVLVGAALTVFLLYFILASGDLFQAKLVKVLPTLSDKKRALRMSRDVERQISRYLLTITAINIGLGLVVAGTMYLLDMPSPVLWGVAAAVLNYLPYIGGVIGVGVVGLVAVTTFPTIWDALPVPAAYALITAMEGNFITPALVGRRLELNPVVVLVSVAFWGWIWGAIGALMAVPMLVVVKILSDNIEGMHSIGAFLEARDAKPVQDED